MFMNKSLFKKKMLKTILFDEDDEEGDEAAAVVTVSNCKEKNEPNKRMNKQPQDISSSNGTTSKKADRFKNIYSLNSPPPRLPNSSPTSRTCVNATSSTQTENNNNNNGVSPIINVLPVAATHNEEKWSSEININKAASFAFLHDESLTRLRERQKELLMSTKKLYSSNNRNEDNSMDDLSDSISKQMLTNNNDNTSQLTSGEDVLDSEVDKNPALNNKNPALNNKNTSAVDTVKPQQVSLQALHQHQPSNSAEIINSSSSISMEKYQNVANSQKQLRIYIQNLENKLNNLRNEMNDNVNNSLSVNVVVDTVVRGSGDDVIGEKRRDRDSSSDSNDSLREIKISTKGKGRTALFNEFLDKCRNVETVQYQEAVARGGDEQDEMEKSFLESQLLGNIDKQRDHDPRADNDNLLESSVHKNSLNELMFMNSRKHIQQDSLVKKCDFTPINSNLTLPSIASNPMPECKRIDHVGFSSSYVPRSSHQQLLLNPKPIRLSSSSSSFDSVTAPAVADYSNRPAAKTSGGHSPSHHAAAAVVIQSPRSNSSSCGSGIRIDSNSKVWKVKPSATSNTMNIRPEFGANNASSAKNKWSDILSNNASGNNMESSENNNFSNEIRSASFKAK
jgi:hypothetical protein